MVVGSKIGYVHVEGRGDCTSAELIAIYTGQKNSSSPWHIVQLSDDTGVKTIRSNARR